jgi:hypothetical protein
MRHLKLYEDIENYKKFWLISTEPKEYELTLMQLKVPKYNEYYEYDLSSFGDDKAYFGIFKDEKKIVYNWNRATRDGYINFIDSNYEYCGEIKIPEYMISGEKYNL